MKKITKALFMTTGFVLLMSLDNPELGNLNILLIGGLGVVLILLGFNIKENCKK